MAEQIVLAKCISESFQSYPAIRYFPGDMINLDLADKEQRKLLWLKTPRGKWIFQFDRASSSNTALRIWFCKECGEPFERFSDFGTHANQSHSKDKLHVAKVQQDNADEEEERLIAEQRAIEEAEDNEQNNMLKDALIAQQGDRVMGLRK